MTEIEIKGALADRGLTDAEVRLDYAGESFRISVVREHNGYRVSHSKQWWDEVRE